MKNIFPKIPLLLSIIFFIFSCFVLFLLYGKINDNNQKSQIAGEEWQKEADRREEMRSLEHSVKIIKQERDQLETHFAQSSDIVPFLDTIESLAPKTGVKAEISSVDIVDNKTALKVVINSTGSFEGLYKFLMLLENSSYELEFMSVDLHQKDGQDLKKGIKVPNWEVAISVKLLSFVN